MDPDEIRENVNKTMKKEAEGEDFFEDSEEDAPKKISTPFLIGYLLGVAILFAISYLSWQAIAPKFGLPLLSAWEFFLAGIVLNTISRFFRKK